MVDDGDGVTTRGQATRPPPAPVHPAAAAFVRGLVSELMQRRRGRFNRGVADAVAGMADLELGGGRGVLEDIARALKEKAESKSK